ncbi:MAG TPA: 2-hydroxyacyl-CoA dehydratase family protein [Syntrophales bacterium]|nr:2-hydroxyacyl-CoA dehydratase family protein [Syntrophales bacterium]HOX94245.1 2-hydroxyacyl-CoA dehydratase family protein [Syntrophales bacterium]HPI58276.1 2-hydroxyacyl-CoA dehydratase family protein [Syntrophales bacterium]HPN26094.1 2-hydroxyacyl-CoA dehydratase family protein [Syntrophales bacterium]HQM30470.1 2-hydroxyacyl-CoA dehydratase family protein [Syntrophales bacterium]
MTGLNDIYEILKDPAAYGRKLKGEGRRGIVGYFCSYTPEEIIYAAGAHPFRLFGSDDTIHLADAHFQSYCCSLVRGALEGALAGRLDFLDGVVFPHTCDSIQRLSDIWRMNVKGPFHLDVVLPVKLGGESSKTYMTDVLQRFRAELQARLGAEIGLEALRAAIGTFNRIRGYLSRLYEIKSEDPGLISGSDLHAIVKASMIMDRDRLLETLPRIVTELSDKKGQRKEPAGKRLVMAGGVCNHPDVYRFIEEAGGVVVGDDLCTGSRYFDGIVELNDDPIRAIADRYMTRSLCPAKHAGLFTRSDRIVDVVREKKALGVVFILLKFCDPHAFDYPYLKEALDRQGIPSLLLEVEDRLPSEGQLQTRFETFIEML